MQVAPVTPCRASPSALYNRFVGKQKKNQLINQNTVCIHKSDIPCNQYTLELIFDNLILMVIEEKMVIDRIQV